MAVQDIFATNFFLSYLITQAKKNYWPTKLDIAGFVWVIQKVQRIIKSSRAKIIIKIDYATILNILNLF